MFEGLLGGLLNIAGTLAGKVLIGLGISVVTYSGISFTTDWLQTQAINNLTLLPPEVVGMLAMMKVGTCIAMISAAIATRLGLEGLLSDTVKKWVGV